MEIIKRVLNTYPPETAADSGQIINNSAQRYDSDDIPQVFICPQPLFITFITHFWPSKSVQGPVALFPHGLIFLKAQYGQFYPICPHYQATTAYCSQQP